jgi:hypothetical protein
MLWPLSDPAQSVAVSYPKSPGPAELLQEPSGIPRIGGDLCDRSEARSPPSGPRSRPRATGSETVLRGRRVTMEAVVFGLGRRTYPVLPASRYWIHLAEGGDHQAWGSGIAGIAREKAGLPQPLRLPRRSRRQ